MKTENDAENEITAVEQKQDADIKDSSSSPKDTTHVTSPAKADEAVVSKSSPGIVCMYVCNSYVCSYVCMYVCMCITAL